LVGRFHEKEAVMTRQAFQLIREGQYAAEVLVELQDNGSDWGPTIGPDDIRKLDRVRIALREGDLARAGNEATVFRLVPLEAQMRPAAGLGECEQDGYDA
jgi:hypothetical protein